MKKTLILTLTILSALLILDSMNAWHAVAMFYLAGEIPGTHHSLSAATMMEVFAMLTGFVIARISNRAILSLLVRKTTTFEHA